MTPEPEPLPPQRALDAACESIGVEWVMVANLNRGTFLYRSIIAHARTLAEKPEPVDPRVEALAEAMGEKGWFGYGAKQLLAAFDRECAKRRVKP